MKKKLFQLKQLIRTKCADETHNFHLRARLSRDTLEKTGQYDSWKEQPEV